MQNLGVILRTFWEKAVSYLTLQMSLTDIIEIIIISVLIYYMLVWIKDTRAWMLLRGILVILAFVLLAVLFEMNTIVWIADKLFNVAMIAVVVIFQPEMRKALENLLYVPFEFENGGTRVIHYTPESYEPVNA